MSRQHESEHFSVGDTVEVSGDKYDGCVGVVERVSPQKVKLDTTVGMVYKHQVHLRAKMRRQHESEHFSVGDTPALGRPSSLDSKEGTPSRCTRGDSSDGKSSGGDSSGGDSSGGDSGGGGDGDGGGIAAFLKEHGLWDKYRLIFKDDEDLYSHSLHLVTNNDLKDGNC
jgi:hypothetical protein